MSMASCANCGDIYDTDFQMQVNAEGNCICNLCKEKEFSCDHEYNLVEDGLIQYGKCKKCGVKAYRLKPETKITMPDWMEDIVNSGKPTGETIKDIMEGIARRNKQ